jgi:3-phytase
VLRLPGLSTVGYVGGGELASPLGITGAAAGGGVYDLWITDAYPAAQAAAPDLGRRVRHYRVRVGGDRFGAEHVAAFGETAGPGALHTVESIAVDSEAGRLLVADEDASRMGLRDYGAGGRFAGRVVEGFDHAPEGIALYPCADGGGYWVAADQAPRRTVFLVLDRRTLEPVGRFAGERTANTDGVWLSTVPVPGFPAGALYAAHDDMSVTAFDWRAIAEALGLRADCAAEGK